MSSDDDIHQAIGHNGAPRVNSDACIYDCVMSTLAILGPLFLYLCYFLAYLCDSFVGPIDPVVLECLDRQFDVGRVIGCVSNIFILCTVFTFAVSICVTILCLLDSTLWRWGVIAIIVHVSLPLFL
jgi:hypothetical protein